MIPSKQSNSHKIEKMSGALSELESIIYEFVVINVFL